MRYLQRDCTVVYLQKPRAGADTKRIDMYRDYTKLVLHYPYYSILHTNMVLLSFYTIATIL